MSYSLWVKNVSSLLWWVAVNSFGSQWMGVSEWGESVKDKDIEAEERGDKSFLERNYENFVLYSSEIIIQGLDCCQCM